MHMLRRFGLYMALLWAVAVQAAVYTPSSVPDPKAQGQGFYVSNPDALLADSDVVWLNACAQQLDAATHVEMCVVALQSIGQSDAFDFAYELYQRWGIGRKGQNTGVLILFVELSHDIRIMTGVGMEGVLTDAQCSQIIRTDMTPAFRQGDYGAGLCLGALRIYEICTDGETPEELLAIRSVTNRGKYAQEENDDEAEIWIAVVALIIFFGVLIWASRQGNKGGRSGGHGSGGGGPVIFFGGGGGSSGGFSGGGFSGGSWGGGSTFGGGAGGKW